MIDGTTTTGFAFHVDEANANDMRFVEALAELKESVLAYPKVIEMLLGKEQKESLYKHLEDENGRVPLEAMEAAFEEIMSASTELKNS